jgi:hypothetical protein
MRYYHSNTDLIFPQNQLHVFTPQGRLLATFTPPQPSACGLGIRTVSWHPSGRFLAIGGWDGHVCPFFFFHQYG